jgi:polar amino acid transport system substrate-binding protein
MRHLRLVLALAIGMVALLAGGCATQSSDASDTVLRSLANPTTTTVPPTTTTGPQVPCTDPLASLAPDAPLPPPGQMPEGTPMREIQDHGKLVVGIDENTLGWAALNPETNDIEGLEVDLVKEIARAIFGDPNQIVFKTVVTAQKNEVVRTGDVDLTASADSMSCDRWNIVSFSSEYFTAHQKLMVRVDSPIHGASDLAGRTVCVTAGSSSVALLQEIAPKARSLEVQGRTDCLVALQQGDAAAYLAHDTFLLGMVRQDPQNMQILPTEYSTQDYGIAIAHERPALVRFVNGVLEQMRGDGRLVALYLKWLGVAAPAQAPAAKYQSA